MRLFKIPFDDSDSAPEIIAKEIELHGLNEDSILPFFDVEEVKKEEAGEKLFSALEQTDKVVSLSGSHMISAHLISSFSKKYNNCGVIIFDAHPDCDGEDDILPSIMRNNVKNCNIILVGTRGWKSKEAVFLKSNRIRMFEMKKVIDFGKEDVIETIMETARSFKALYISIDLDVLDPCFAPGVGCYEPGGMSSRDLLFFLQRLKKLQNLKAIDITELKPEKDINGMTAKLAAKIAAEMC